MTMFEELHALATGATLTMIVSADEKTGRMTVHVIPKPKKDVDEPALTKALSLTATPQEFDAGFVEALRGYREVRHSLAEQAEATKEVLEAAKQASVKKAGDAASKASKPAAPASSAPGATAPAIQVSSTTEDDETGDQAQAPAAAIASGSAPLDLFG
ncbi:MAG: PRTRC system protein E [Vitreoscilla sp.]|jgi:PRTRC genetic system protein E|nr:PRTRC system protein E [Vitreoscilla sp.]